MLCACLSVPLPALPTERAPKRPATGKEEGTGPARRKPGTPPPLPKPTVARTPNTRPLLRPNEFLAPSQLRRGMKGVGLTVFQGNRIERFDVTILGVVRKANNGRDLILVRLSGPTLRRVSDIISGMSGSPVYVGGKIIGAVAYGASFTRESIGYVTPIEDMLEAWDPGLPQTPDDNPAPLPEPPDSDLTVPLFVSGQRYDRVRIDSARTGASPPGVLRLRPLMARVTVTGVSGPRFATVARELAEIGLDARRNGGGVAAPGLTGSPLTPGGAVAMSLATGDIDITGIGTVTYRRGDRIVAFGHPFLGIGPLRAPMFTAYIHDIQPSFNESQKVGSPVTLVGAFSQDRPYSISGRIGDTPSMMPLTVRVRDRMMGKVRTFKAKLIRHPLLLSRLINIASSAAVAEIHGQPGEATAVVTTTVETEGFGTIRRTNRVQDSAAIEGAVGEDLKNAVNFLLNNSYGRVGIRSVAMEVDITPGKQTATIERIFLPGTRFEPGETIEVGAVLKPYRKPEQVRRLTLKIPPGTAPGVYNLTVQGGPTGYASSGLLSLFMGRGIDFSGTTSVPQMIRRYGERDRNDALVARLTLPTSSLSVRGEKLDGLPPNLEAVLRMIAGRTSGTRLERDECKTVATTPWVLSGMQTLPVRIGVKGGVEPVPGSPVVAPSAPSPEAGLPLPAPVPPSPQSADRGTGGVVRRESGSERVSEVRDTARDPGTGGSEANEGAERTGASPESAPEPASAAPKMVGRPPGIWRQVAPNDFRSGVRDGVTLTGQGTLQFGPRLRRIADCNEPVFWCLTSDGEGGVFAGSGEQGRIYRVSTGGKCDVVATTGEIAVHTMVRSGNGDLFAGTSPNGKVFRMRPDGKVRLLFRAEEKHVLSLALSPDETILYAATGGPRAAVYAVPLSGSGGVTTVYRSGEGSVTTLHCDRDGTLYAGTAPNGLFLRLTGSNGRAIERPEVRFDAPEPAITGIRVRPDGGAYLTTAPRGMLYRVSPERVPEPLTERPFSGPLNGLVGSADGTLYSAVGNTIVSVDPVTDRVRMTDAPTDVLFTQVCLTANGTLFAATGGVASVFAPDSSGPAAGTYVSPVFDARSVVRWGTLRFFGEVSRDGTLKIRTRTGNTADPDSDWSPWSPELSRPEGERVTSPSGRYLQYRVEFSDRSDRSDPDVLKGVEVYFRMPNRMPSLSLQSPRPAEVWRGEKTIRWSAQDPDRDTLSFEIRLSADGGRTWQAVPTKKGSGPVSVPGTEPAAPTTARPGSPKETTASAALALAEELDRHPEIGPELRQRMLADASAHSAPTPPSATPPLTQPSARETFLTFDTTKIPDGEYRIRVTATDRASNPDDPLTAEAISETFRVVNRSPAISLREPVSTGVKERTVVIEGVAIQAGASIRGVQFRSDNGEWLSAAAKDGIFDSPLESFTVTTEPLTSGSHVIEIQVIDEAGNVATQKVTATVRNG
ncbi:MAG: SpoIVB peptidase S55 domain-containing protein [Capsulimonadales bacterium]|nr:SpoIVB peptidase S55 domain-containing protein [Capsulimonadales bacterium]